MFNFSSPFFPLLILFITTTTAQPYKSTDHIVLNCGSSTSSQQWVADQHTKFISSNTDTTTSFSSAPDYLDPSVPETPYSTARIFNTSSFTYTFPVSQGPKFLRLFFYPATYSGLNANQSFFSISSNGYSLLTNFSAFLTASFLSKTASDAGAVGPAIPHFVREFIIYVKDTQWILNVIFTPSPNSYAFINGIEIVSMPEKLYFIGNNLKGSIIDDDIALENIYRLNMGGRQVPGNEDSGMYRSWGQDNYYILPPSNGGLIPTNATPITYTTETPNYIAPEIVYETQRSMGQMSNIYNLTWILPVDSGFYYMLRLHFCNIIPQYKLQGDVVFKIFIKNKTAEEEIDILRLDQGSGHPVVKDYLVRVSDPDGHRSKADLWLALHPNNQSLTYLDGYLNGLEVFKLSTDGSLSGYPPPIINPPTIINPVSSMEINNQNTKPYATVIGGVMGGLVLLLIVVLLIVWRVKHYSASTTTDDKPFWGLTSSDASQLPHSCRRFTLKEVKNATNKFNENFVIGKGGFGQVYKGYIDNNTTTVAIKRLSTSSRQGFQEFKTEIQLMSKLRHDHLVSLIGYCDHKGEMILVYDYMAHGTLREHLYNSNNPPLSWETRLQICIGAAKGLQYLHTGIKRAIIHRDVKSTNILLDENWVAKVSDFGLSKIGSKDPSETHVTTNVKGSICYIDPEYRKSQHLREKSDVYSFGVVLFEVLCARPVIDPWVPGEQVSLAEWGKSCYQRGTLIEIIDQKISGEIAIECLNKFGEVANSCLHEEGSQRPAMCEIVGGLECSLELQKAAENTSTAVPENQEPVKMDDNVEDNGIKPFHITAL